MNIPTQKLAVKAGAGVAIVGFITIFGCSDQSLTIAILSVLVLTGEAAINDILPWLNGGNGE